MYTEQTYLHKGWQIILLELIGKCMESVQRDGWRIYQFQMIAFDI